MSFSKHHSAPPAPNTNRRISITNRLSLSLGLQQPKQAFSIEEAKSLQATDLALRIGNKDPNLPCVDDVSFSVVVRFLLVETNFPWILR
jgi:hypothetical protein